MSPRRLFSQPLGRPAGFHGSSSSTRSRTGPCRVATKAQFSEEGIRRSAALGFPETTCGEVLHSQVWLQSPVTVIADNGDEAGRAARARIDVTFPEHPFGPHPWQSFDAWSRTQVLQLYRADLLYSVWMFFENGEFQNWYLNFEAHSFATSTPSTPSTTGSISSSARRNETLEGRRGSRTDAPHRPHEHDRAGEVLEAAEQVSQSLADNNRWWSSWDNWRPPPAAR